MSFTRRMAVMTSLAALAPGAALAAQRETMIFDTSSRVENDPRRQERELFAAVPYVQPGT